MGYFGNLEAKIKAQKLRSKGLSYKEIQKTLPVPKSTLSGWCRDIAITEEQALRLFKNKLQGAAKGRIIGAKRQQAKRIRQTRELYADGKDQIGKLNAKNRFVAGIALYAAEGTKTDTACCFSNSDPALIKFMADWFREFCHVPEDKFRGAIWLHEGLSENKAKKYWADLAHISIKKFHKTYIAKNKIGSKKIRKNIHNFGVFSLRVSDAKIHRRLMGWIAGVFGQKLL